MGRTGKSTATLAPGIYVHATFIRVIAKAGAKMRERHYPPGTALPKMQAWQLREKATLLEGQPVRPQRGSLAADIPTYLATLTGRRRKDETAIAHHWLVSPLASMRREVIRRADIKGQMAAWEAAGVAASTINHRLRILRNVYRELDAGEDDAVDPTAGIRKLREPDPQIRAVPYDVIEAVIAFMVPRGRAARGQSHAQTVNQSRARARVMAWTGLPPAQLMKVQPGDVNWTAATLDVTPRRKGKGTKARTVPLLPQAVDALKSFFAAGAAGRFSTSSFRQRWLGAQRRLVAEIRRQVEASGGDPSAIVLPPIRPYDMRHSFGTEALRRSGDLVGVKELMLHAKLTTTERYIQGAVADSARNVLAAWQLPTGANGANSGRPAVAVLGRNRSMLKRNAG